jgi:hypothetical protein
MDRNMKSILILVAISVGLIFASVESRHFESIGGFSYCAPQGWKYQEYPGLKFQIAKGYSIDSAFANVNITDEKSNNNIEIYTDSLIIACKKQATQFELLDKYQFKTTSGIDGYIVITNGSFTGKKVHHQLFYVFKGPENKYLIFTYTCPVKNGNEYKKIFEESIKTIEIIETTK